MSQRRWDRVRTVGLGVLVVLLAGCGQATSGGPGTGTGGTGGTGGTAAGGTSRDFDARAAEVARRWRTAATSQAWRTGLVPLQDLTIEPVDGFADSETKQAFAAGAYAASVALPSSSRRTTVRFADGSTMPVTAVSADAAYRALRQVDPTCGPKSGAPPSPVAPEGRAATPPPLQRPPGGLVDAGAGGTVSTVAPPMCGRLTIISATAVTATIRTSRGQASVPAWRFGFKETAATVTRVALDESAVTPVPEVLVPVPVARGLVGAQSWERAEGSTVGFTVGVGACDQALRAQVYETPQVVVVGGTITPPAAETACIDLLKLDPVRAQLRAPVGSRVVLDVLSGRPLVLGGR